METHDTLEKLEQEYKDVKYQIEIAKNRIATEGDNISKLEKRLAEIAMEYIENNIELSDIRWLTTHAADTIGQQ